MASNCTLRKSPSVQELWDGIAVERTVCVGGMWEQVAREVSGVGYKGARGGEGAMDRRTDDAIHAPGAVVPDVTRSDNVIVSADTCACSAGAPLPPAGPDRAHPIVEGK